MPTFKATDTPAPHCETVSPPPTNGVPVPREVAGGQCVKRAVSKQTRRRQHSSRGPQTLPTLGGARGRWRGGRGLHLHPGLQPHGDSKAPCPPALGAEAGGRGKTLPWKLPCSDSPGS